MHVPVAWAEQRRKPGLAFIERNPKGNGQGGLNCAQKEERTKAVREEGGTAVGLETGNGIYRALLASLIWLLHLSCKA